MVALAGASRNIRSSQELIVNLQLLDFLVQGCEVIHGRLPLWRTGTVVHARRLWLMTLVVIRPMMQGCSTFCCVCVPRLLNVDSKAR